MNAADVVTPAQQAVLWRFRYLTRRLTRGECYGGSGNSRCTAADLDACMERGLVVVGPGPERRDGKPGAPRYAITPAGLAALQAAMEARPQQPASHRMKAMRASNAPAVPGMAYAASDLLLTGVRDNVAQLVDGGTRRMPSRRGAE